MTVWGNYVYRYEGDSISVDGFSSSCLRATQEEITVVIPNMTTGDIQVLDADYFFRLTGGSGVGQDQPASRTERVGRPRPGAAPQIIW